VRSLGISLMPLLLAAAQPSELEQALGRPPRAATVPAELSEMVREATAARIVVRGLGGGDIAVELAQIEAEGLTAYAGRRYLGFNVIGYEFFGYQLIDRRMTGEAAVIETGEAPVFSPDGRHFAAVQVSGAGYGNLEGVAIWRVDAEETVQILFNDVLPLGEEWRIDGWPRADCVSVSWTEWQPGGAQSTPQRRHLGIEVGAPIRIVNSHGFPGCNVTDATGE
jgi:hypothetical protein